MDIFQLGYNESILLFISRRKQETEADYLGLIFNLISWIRIIRESINLWKRMAEKNKGKTENISVFKYHILPVKICFSPTE